MSRTRQYQSTRIPVVAVINYVRVTNRMPATGRELSSWKEIAAHLGVGVRTAQSWERTRGLPVHRLPGGRGQVIALVAELREWKYSADGIHNGSNGAQASVEGEPVGHHRRLGPGVVIMAAVVALAALILTGLWLRPNLPAGFRIDHQDIVITDAHGRELWRKKFPAMDTRPDNQGVLFWTGDLEGNGAISVLFTFHNSIEGPSDKLFCYSASGAERWRFEAGRTVHTRHETFLPPFGIHRFQVLPNHRIVVTSHHYLYYPAQVALLTANGKLEKEYWHSGHLPYLITRTAGSSTQLILGGTNNAAKTATIVVLDSSTMTGASVEQQQDYQILGFAPGSEVKRVLFPRSEMNRLLEPFTVMDSLWQEQQELVARVDHRVSPLSAAIYYHLNPDFTLRTAGISSSFDHEYRAVEAQGIIKHPLDDAEKANLNQITYR